MLSVHSNAHLFSRLIARLSAALALVACLVVPAAAQVTYTGTTASQNFGSVAIGTSKTVSLSFSVAAGTTVGSIGVVTQGAPNLDFTNAAATTCTATTYTSAATCSVSVTFTPKAAGVRRGAVVFFSAANNTGTQLGSAAIYGLGTGAQIAYGPGAATAIAPTVNGEGLGPSWGVAVDGAGDLFVADEPNGRVVEVPVGGGAPTSIGPTVGGEGLSYPTGLAVDGAGDLFIADTGNNRVVEVPAGGGPAIALDPIVNGATLLGPDLLAMDGQGDLFIADDGHDRIVEVPAGSGAATAIDPTVNGEGLYFPSGVAVDGAGDLFIADSDNDRVVEVPAGGGTAVAINPTVNGKTLHDPTGIALDSAGDLFIADLINSRVVEVPAGGGAATAIEPTLGGAAISPTGLTLDSGGDLFIADYNNSRVVEIQHSQVPAVNFPTPTPVDSTDTIDGTQTVQIVNIGNQQLEFAGLTYPADFPDASADASACTNSTSLSAGQECDLPINFAPEEVGSPLNESVTLTDNALQVTGAQQMIAVSGTSLPPTDTLYLPPPGSVLKGPELTFAWTPLTGATGYSLWIGSTGAGSDNLYSSHETTATSVKVAGLPTNSETLYVRLYTTSGKATVHSDYTYTATKQAAMISPANGGKVLFGTSLTFTWSPATGATGYSLWLGSTGPGSDNVYVSHETTNADVTTNRLSTFQGETIYARLYTTYGNVTVYSDYTYTAN